MDCPTLMFLRSYSPAFDQNHPCVHKLAGGDVGLDRGTGVREADPPGDRHPAKPATRSVHGAKGTSKGCASVWTAR